jgi:DNA-binding MarR family transcriptional regulator
VHRSACPTDKRGQFAELTDAGFDRLDSAARGHVEEVRAYLFDVLSPEQQRALREISEAITASLGDA